MHPTGPPRAESEPCRGRNEFPFPGTGRLPPSHSDSANRRLKDHNPAHPPPGLPHSVRRRCPEAGRGARVRRGSPGNFPLLAPGGSGQSPDGHASHPHPDPLAAPASPAPCVLRAPLLPCRGSLLQLPDSASLPEPQPRRAPPCAPGSQRPVPPRRAPAPVGRARGAIKWRALCRLHAGPQPLPDGRVPHPREDSASARVALTPSSTANQRTAGGLAGECRAAALQSRTPSAPQQRRPQPSFVCGSPGGLSSQFFSVTQNRKSKGIRIPGGALDQTLREGELLFLSQPHEPGWGFERDLTSVAKKLPPKQVGNRSSKARSGPLAQLLWPYRI